MTITTQQQNAIIGLAGAGVPYFLKQDMDMLAFLGGGLAAVPMIAKFTTPDTQTGGVDFNHALPAIGGGVLAFAAYKNFKEGADIICMATKACAGVLMLVQNASKAWVSKVSTPNA